MITTKGVSIGRLLKLSGIHIIWLLLLMGGVAALYYFEIINFSIPWLAISVISTAVAFYVGFKNNQAYDRVWEARKIWGGIVNESRSWGMMVDGFITNLFSKDKVSEDRIKTIKKRLIYRHIAWLYAHRSQLLVSTSWEHINQGGYTARSARFYQNKFGTGLVDDEVTKVELSQFLPKDEYDRLINQTNTAAQIVNEQMHDLAELRKIGLIDDFRHMEMSDVLREFYRLQGKNERIKKFPLPRQYANMSRYFVGIFIALLPFSMVPDIIKLDDNWGIWLSVPVTALVGWIYVMMEIVGDYSENPFQGMPSDIPMLSLCRTIEIDLREMLGDSDIPEPIKDNKGILM